MSVSNRLGIREIFMYTKSKSMVQSRGGKRRELGRPWLLFLMHSFPHQEFRGFGRLLVLLDFLPSHLGRTSRPVMVSVDCRAVNLWLEPLTSLVGYRKSRPPTKTFKLLNTSNLTKANDSLSFTDNARKVRNMI